MNRRTGRRLLVAVVIATLPLTGCASDGTSTATGSPDTLAGATKVSTATSVPSPAEVPAEGTRADVTPGPGEAEGIPTLSGPPGIDDDAEPNPTSAVPPADPAVPTPEPGPPAGETVAPEPPVDPAAVTGFSSSVSVIDEPLAARMATSWRAGCPVPLSDLRYLTVTYRGFDGADHTGELVVASAVTADVATIFGRLYAAGYPIASLRLVDDFGGSDDASMAANNTSAFNCRPVTGGGGFSEHSYGTAIDLNPVQNPYVSGSVVLPEAGRVHLNRAPGPGVIQPTDAVVTAFAESGWSWGGYWSGPVDYQHFSVSGR